MNHQTGYIWDDAWDAAEDVAEAVADATTSVIDAAGKAGHEIGAVLKTIAPIISMIPGFGTAIGAAFYAAGAIAAKDEITDAVIGTAGIAMPPGIPRIAFGGAVNVTRDVVKGENAFGSVVAACREAAGQVGGDRATAAFDAGLALGRGERVDQAAVNATRATLANGGPAAVAAFDTAVGIARNDKATDVLVGVAREYITTTGGPLAAAAFDAGIALANGQAIQEAGWNSLKSFVKASNGPVAQVLGFIEAMAKGRKLGVALQSVLESDLAREVQGYLGNKLGSLVDASVIDKAIQPYINAIKINPEFLKQLPMEMVYARVSEEVFNAGDEVLARTAQAIMRAGSVDTETLKAIENTQFIGTFANTESSAASASNTQLAILGHQIMAAGAMVRGVRVSAIRARPTVTMSVDVFDGLSGKTVSRMETFETTEDWRRGFDVAIGLCEGMSENGSGQQAVRSSLVLINAQRGFDAGQTIQHQRTKDRVWQSANLKQNEALIASIQAKAPPPAMTLPSFQAMQQTMAKSAERARWVAHYASFPGTMTGGDY